MIATASVYGYLSVRDALLSPVWVYLILYAVVYGIYIYAGVRLIPQLGGKLGVWLPLILVTAVIFRLIFVDTAPSLSTDIYRYVWDGRLTCHGVNPYKWAPYDGRLAEFRDASIWYPMEYKFYNTIYMPVSQAIFALVYALGGSSLAAFKLCYVLFDAGVMALMVLILRERKLPVSNVYWYAWCPLPITEIGIAGHQDVVGVFCLLFAILLMVRKRPMKSAALLMAAAFTKGFAFLVLPALVRRYGKNILAFTFIAFAALGMPIWVELQSFTHGMKQYLGSVHVNSGVFYLVNKALRTVIPDYSYQITSRLGNIGMLAAIFWSVRTPITSSAEFIRRATIVIAVCLLVVPTLFPWYVIWLLPLALIMRPKPAFSFVALSGSVALMYLYYYDLTILWWFRALEYVPFYLLLWKEYKEGYWAPVSEASGDADAGDDEGAEPVSVAAVGNATVVV